MGQQLNQFILRYAEQVIRWRWMVILLTIVLVMLAVIGMKNLSFSTNYRVFFSSDNPELQTFDEFQKNYTKNDNIIFIVQPKNGKVFSSQIAHAIENLTRQAWEIPYALRVDSITNFQHSWAEEDDLTVEDLIRNAQQLSEGELSKKQTIALAEPLLKNNLISSDADTTGVNIILQYPELSITEVPKAVAKARAIAEQMRQDYPDLTIALSGLSMLNNAFAEAGETDAQSLVPIMYLILLIIMAISLRSVSGMLTTFLVIGFSSATAIGLAGHFGIQLTPISVTAPTIILTLAIADSIHILVTMLTLMREGHDKVSALKESLRINFLPVSITSVTTIIGFLSLNFSDAPPYWDLGNITAMGIAAAWLYSLAFLPALMSLLPLNVERHSKPSFAHHVLDGLAEFVIKRYRSILLVFGTLTIVLISFVPNIQLNDEFVKYFDERIEFRNDAEFGIKHLNGVYIIEYSIAAQEAGGISEPNYLNNLEQFSNWLNQQPEVTHVYSYSDIIKRLNKNMHGDEQAWYKIPQDRELAAQYLLLYELSLPYGLDLNDRVNIDKSATRVSATLKDISTVEIRDFLSRTSHWLKQNTPEYMWAEPTGATVMFAYISQRNIESMLTGNALAVALIALIMMLTLRSLSIGAMSVIPNAVPILVTFGIWSILVGQIGMAAASVVATSLGIIVDDTVHFLAKYLHARRDKGYSRPDAIRYAFQIVGLAIVITTFILSIGFIVLATSTFLINSQMGLMTSMAIIVALLFDFLLLPALLLINHKKEETVHEYQTENKEKQVCTDAT